MTRRSKPIILFVFAAMLPTFASAEAPRRPVGAAHDTYRKPLPDVGRKGQLILRQDLFDRQNPTNLRSDWPSPPAQPGQI
ncbi:hypothetical protein ABID59_002153 [Bradyrhizobium sp. S3.3.6]